MRERYATAPAGPIRIETVALYDWSELLQVSRSEGHGMVDRLVTDFRVGINRFDALGEVLLAYLDGSIVVAAGGLNREADRSFGRAGRVRRLYVMPGYRGQGLARGLIEELVLSARGHFDVLTVNAGKLTARGFYEHLGFRTIDRPRITHVMRLTPRSVGDIV